MNEDKKITLAAWLGGRLDQPAAGQPAGFWLSGVARAASSRLISLPGMLRNTMNAKVFGFCQCPQLAFSARPSPVLFNII